MHTPFKDMTLHEASYGKPLIEVTDLESESNAIDWLMRGVLLNIEWQIDVQLCDIQCMKYGLSNRKSIRYKDIDCSTCKDLGMKLEVDLGSAVKSCSCGTIRISSFKCCLGSQCSSPQQAAILIILCQAWWYHLRFLESHISRSSIHNLRTIKSTSWTITAYPLPFDHVTLIDTCSPFIIPSCANLEVWHQPIWVEYSAITAMLRPATPLSILLFASFVLLLISTISTPIVKGIPLARNDGVNYGVFGWCPDVGACSGVQVGWNTGTWSWINKTADSDMSR